MENFRFSTSRRISELQDRVHVAIDNDH